MENEIVTSIDDFPEELILPIKALSDKTRRKLVLALLDSKEFSYTQLQTGFNIKRGTLNHHLHSLVSAGLIRNFNKLLPVSQYSSYYQITNFGYRFVEGLLQSFSEPKIVECIQGLQSTAYFVGKPLGSSPVAWEDEQRPFESTPEPACLVANK